MRVIGGKYRGRKLKALEGEATRPTLDRVKESMFNMAMPYLNGADVLDLFGGSGGLAIEALSRGAREAYINDASKAAACVIKENLQTVGCEENARVYNLTWQAMIKEILHKGLLFDIIILDPPYENDYIYDCVRECKKMLNQGGAIIVEHNENTKFTEDVIKQKRYGKVFLTFLGALK